MVHYIPIATTLLSIVFFMDILRHWRSKPGATYLFWWMAGVLTFGLGTLSESIHALAGWQDWNVRFWYVVGALLGGFPLAQGTAYLMLPRRLAHGLTVFFVSLIVVATVCVVLSPMLDPATVQHRLTGGVFEWQWVRAFSPAINLYSFLLLVGGAAWSAAQYVKLGPAHVRFLGNVLIAVGALLPGIGGMATRLGHVEVLFVTELLGLLAIYAGYRLMRSDRSGSIHAAQGRPVAVKLEF
jgi:hypothetical protein